MGWIISIITLLGVFIYIGNNIANGENNKNSKKYSDKGYHFIEYCGVEYKGGIKDLSIDTPIIIDLLEEGLSFNNLMYEKIISFNNIIDMSLQSKQYIENQVSLGKLFFFGILAFGMKKNQNKINDEFIILKIKENEETYNILLQAQDYTNNQNIYNKILMYKNKTRL
jgi:hypothetical protein